MKRFSILVLVFTLVALMLASCGLGGHEHTFSTDWSKDETNHWITCTDEACADVKVATEAHKDVNNDKLCDVCGYDYSHTHTYQAADAWTSDATNHWHAATCGCSIAVKDSAAHADANNDGACDTCGYNAGHTHTYADAWETDATHHWHAADCGHTVAPTKEAHDLDALGFCKVCDKAVSVDVSTVDKAIAVGALKDALVKYGTIVGSANTSSGDTGENVNVDYAMVGEVLHIIEVIEEFYPEYSEWGSVIGTEYDTTKKEYLYSLYGEDSILALVKEGVGAFERETYDVSTGMFGGYDFGQEYIAIEYGEEYSPYGIIGLLTELYTRAILNEYDGFEQSVSEDGVYSFSFLSYGYYLYSITVEFTLDENYVIDTFNMTSKAYGEYQFDENYDVIGTNFTITYKTDENDNQILDEEDNPIVESIALSDDAVASTTYVYEVKQYTDDRNYDEFGAVANILLEYALKIGNNVIDDSFSAVQGEETKIYFANTVPATANPAYNIFEFVVLDEDGEEMDLDAWDCPIRVYHNGDYISLTSTATGDYTLVISSELTEAKEIDFTVTAPELTSMKAQTLGSESALLWGENVPYSVWTDFTGDESVYTGVDFVFGITTNSIYANNAYTLTVTTVNGDATSVTFGTTTIEIGKFNEEYAYIDFSDADAATFNATVAGTYVVTITSVANAEIYDSFTIVVEEAPSSDSPALSGSGTVDDPYVITESGTYTAIVGSDYVYYTYVATVDGDVVVAFDETSDWSYDYGTFGFNLCDMGFQPTVTKAVTAGQTFYLKVSTYSGNPGNISFTITLPGSSSGSGDSGNGDATEVVGSENIYGAAAPETTLEAGTYTVNVAAGSAAWFYVAWPGTEMTDAYNVQVTFTADVMLQTGTPMFQNTIASGDNITNDANSNGCFFGFLNNTGDAIEVEFTVTITQV
ncbi:MAG: hypothetical protein IJ488_03320 [Clostridia bacterium]|nr:hypothetical protein [Clostridia bacterium]